MPVGEGAKRVSMMAAFSRFATQPPQRVAAVVFAAGRF
jgi:hypothetical protein